MQNTVWFSGWFSSLAITIENIRKKIPGVKIIGTHTNKDCAYFRVCDESYIDPKGLSGEQYIEYALEFCKSHNVKVYMPKTYMNTISDNLDRFTDIGVEVIVENLSNIRALESKIATYERLERIGYENIPEYYIINGYTDYLSGLAKILSKGETPCIKFDKDEGACSFRIISDKAKSYESLKEIPDGTISFEEMESIIKDGERSEQFKPMILMPKLLSPEVSADSYPSKKGLVVIPRFKLGNRIKEIRFNEQIIEDVKRIHEEFKFQSIFNVQYRWDSDGNMKLLEVNTRMSGGIHLSSLCGIDIPAIAIAEKLGVSADIQYTGKNVRVTQYESPIILG